MCDLSYTYSDTLLELVVNRAFDGVRVPRRKPPRCDCSELTHPPHDQHTNAAPRVARPEGPT